MAGPVIMTTAVQIPKSLEKYDSFTTKLENYLRPRCFVDTMNVQKTNRIVKTFLNVISRGYKPLNVLNPLLRSGHMNPICVDEIEARPLKNEIRKPKVIIIGAGIAGLSAAHRLQTSGITDYVILEAKDRTGGRIHTARISNRDVDLGCELIFGAGVKNSVYQLACEEEIFLYPPENNRNCEQMYYTSEGRVIDPFTVMAACSAFRGIEKCARGIFNSKNPSCYGDLQSFLALRIQQQLHGFPKEYQYDAARVMYGQANSLQYHLGGSISEIDTRLYGSRDFLSNFKVRIPHGFKRVLNPLLKDIPSSNIILNKPIQQIGTGISQHDKNGYRATVCCCDGDEYKADYVICTIPVAMLKYDGANMFSPPLTKERMEALALVKSGNCNKIFLEYSSPFWSHLGEFRLAWSPEELENHDDWMKGISMFKQVPEASDILCCYVGGKDSATMEQCSVQDVAERVTFVLRKFFGDVSVPFPNRVMRSTWASDQFAGASTYYLGSDSKLENFDKISAPVTDPESNAPTVFFAGDGYRVDYLGTVHGARTSGIEAAEKLINLTKEICGPPSPSEQPPPCTYESECKAFKKACEN